jgi:hypothetical protein
MIQDDHPLPMPFSNIRSIDANTVVTPIAGAVAFFGQDPHQLLRWQERWKDDTEKAASASNFPSS